MNTQSKFVFQFVLLINILSVGCSSVNQKSISNEKPDLELHATWVQNTLEKTNNGFRKINRMAPLIYKNQLITGNALEGLACYDLTTKNILWRTAIPQGVEAGAALIKDRLFVGSNNGKMYSVDLTNGQIVWTFDTKSEVVAEPLLNEGVLYFLSGSQAVFALDASNGKQLWTYNRQDTSNLMTIRGGSKPAFANGFLYFGFSDGSLVSLNAKTGTPQWEITLNRNARFKDIDASPVISGETLFINSYDDHLYAVSKDKGEILWKSRVGGSSTPAIFGDRVVTSSSKGELVSLSKKDGTVFWKNKTTNGVFIDPVLLKGSIVTAESQGSLIIYDGLTGERRASFEPGRGVFSRPTISAEQNMIYFISNEGLIYGVKISLKDKNSPYYLK